MGKNSFLITGISLIASLALIIFVINPQFKNLRDNRLQAEVKNVEAQALAKRKQALQQIQTTLSNRQDEIAKLKVALPEGLEADEVFIMIESMSASSGLQLDSIQPREGGEISSAVAASVDPGADTAIPGDNSANASLAQATTSNITVNVLGEYNQINTFLQKLDKNIRPISVDNLTMSSQGEGSQESSELISATFELGLLTVPGITGESAANSSDLPFVN